VYSASNESHSEATIYDSYPGGHVSAVPDSGVRETHIYDAYPSTQRGVNDE